MAKKFIGEKCMYFSLIFIFDFLLSFYTLHRGYTVLSMERQRKIYKRKQQIFRKKQKKKKTKREKTYVKHKN